MIYQVVQNKKSEAGWLRIIKPANWAKMIVSNAKYQNAFFRHIVKIHTPLTQKFWLSVVFI